MKYKYINFYKKLMHRTFTTMYYAIDIQYCINRNGRIEIYNGIDEVVSTHLKRKNDRIELLYLIALLYYENPDVQFTLIDNVGLKSTILEELCTQLNWKYKTTVKYSEKFKNNELYKYKALIYDENALEDDE